MEELKDLNEYIFDADQIEMIKNALEELQRSYKLGSNPEVFTGTLLDIGESFDIRGNTIPCMTFDLVAYNELCEIKKMNNEPDMSLRSINDLIGMYAAEYDEGKESVIDKLIYAQARGSALRQASYRVANDLLDRFGIRLIFCAQNKEDARDIDLITFDKVYKNSAYTAGHRDAKRARTQIRQAAKKLSADGREETEVLTFIADSTEKAISDSGLSGKRFRKIAGKKD